jgi:5'-methylthioadenosine phosphorylase
VSATADIGVIGGSGFYALDAIEAPERVELDTPFGKPSGPYVVGTLRGKRVAFLARHGEGHTILPHELPARANIHGFRQLGVERLLAASAVGSLQQHIEPGHAVVPDQLIDRTRGRPPSFFGDGLVAHVGLADPFCASLSHHLATAALGVGVTAHEGGTLVVIEGPAFSTRAESELFRSWGADIVGMTALPEARLAREAELCYASICFVTDYDVWHEHEEDVSADLVLRVLRENTDRARAILAAAIEGLAGDRSCECGAALASALMSAPHQVPAGARQRLALLVDRYWGQADATDEEGGA